MRTTLLPRAARGRAPQPRPRRRRAAAVRVPAASSSPTARSGCRTSTCISASLLAGAFRAGDLALGRATARLLCRQGPAGRACSTRCASTGGSPTAALPFLHPGRAAEVLTGGHEAGWVGELHPLVARSFGLEPSHRRRSSSTSTSCSAAAAAGPTYEDLITLSRRLPGHRRRRRRGRRGADRRGRRARGGRPGAARACACSTSTAASSFGEGKKSLALRLEFQAADRTLTDDEVAARREQISEALARADRREPA